MKEKIPFWELGSMSKKEPSGYIIVEENGDHSHWNIDGCWQFNCGGKCVEKAKLHLENYNLVVNKENIMNTIKNTLKDLMRTEPEKTFIKAGFLDSEENITIKGREALEYILWNNNKDEIKKLADKIIEKDTGR
jgi:hypothetical protein